MLKNLFKRILFETGKFLGFFLKIGGLKIYNNVFENSPHFLVNFFVKFVPFPQRNVIWKIKLLNKKTIKTQIDRNNLKTRQFALSYKWHSPSMNKIEKILNDFYPIDVPWIDVGSNLGLRSLIALSACRPVYFIEPNSELNQLNKKRCELNQFSNYTFFECGASDEEGEVEFFVDISSYNSTIEAYLMKDLTKIAYKQLIKINTIDNLFNDQLNTIKSAFIKIDVEGHELKTLKGARNLIQKANPTILVEVNLKGEHFEEFQKLANSFNCDVFEVGNFKRNKILRRINYHLNDHKKLKHNDFLLVNTQNKNLLKKLKKHEV